MNGYMQTDYISCTLCPRNCRVDRRTHKGYCGMGDTVRVARAALHFWEEPCISGESGSGTVFFSGCQLGCVFCQNRGISHGGDGLDITSGRLADIFSELEEKGANNINLVSATQFVPDVIKALEIARKRGMTLPIVYNSGGYESIETLKMLDGYIDIYLPDFKYMSEQNARKYSKAVDYPKFAKEAIAEMYSQVGKNVFKNGIMVSGMIVRHLVLPGETEDSKRVIKYLHDTYGQNIWLSIMNQYTPSDGLFGELSRKLSDEEYEEILDFAENIGVENAFIQEG